MSATTHNEDELFETWLKKSHFIRFDVFNFNFLMVPKNELITIPSKINYHDIYDVNHYCWNNLLENPTENAVALKETIWEITKIVSRRKWKNQIHYLVEWKSMNGRVFNK